MILNKTNDLSSSSSTPIKKKRQLRPITSPHIRKSAETPPINYYLSPTYHDIPHESTIISSPENETTILQIGELQDNELLPSEDKETFINHIHSLKNEIQYLKGQIQQISPQTPSELSDDEPISMLLSLGYDPLARDPQPIFFCDTANRSKALRILTEALEQKILSPITGDTVIPQPSPLDDELDDSLANTSIIHALDAMIEADLKKEAEEAKQVKKENEMKETKKTKEDREATEVTNIKAQEPTSLDKNNEPQKKNPSPQITLISSKSRSKSRDSLLISQAIYGNRRRPSTHTGRRRAKLPPVKGKPDFNSTMTLDASLMKKLVHESRSSPPSMVSPPPKNNPPPIKKKRLSRITKSRTPASVPFKRRYREVPSKDNKSAITIRRRRSHMPTSPSPLSSVTSSNSSQSARSPTNSSHIMPSVQATPSAEALQHRLAQAGIKVLSRSKKKRKHRKTRRSSSPGKKRRPPFVQAGPVSARRSDTLSPISLPPLTVPSTSSPSLSIPVLWFNDDIRHVTMENVDVTIELWERGIKRLDARFPRFFCLLPVPSLPSHNTIAPVDTKKVPYKRLYYRESPNGPVHPVSSFKKALRVAKLRQPFVP